MECHENKSHPTKLRLSHPCRMGLCKISHRGEMLCLGFLRVVAGGSYAFSTQLPPWELTFPLKKDHFERKWIIFQPSIFNGYVSFQGGIFNYQLHSITLMSFHCIARPSFEIAPCRLIASRISCSCRAPWDNNFHRYTTCRFSIWQPRLKHLVQHCTPQHKLTTTAKPLHICPAYLRMHLLDVHKRCRFPILLCSIARGHCGPKIFTFCWGFPQGTSNSFQSNLTIKTLRCFLIASSWTKAFASQCALCHWQRCISQHVPTACIKSTRCFL